MLLKKFVKTSLVAAAAISMSTAAFAEAKVTTSLSGFVDVMFEQTSSKANKDADKVTEMQMHYSNDTVESQMVFKATYDMGDKKTMLIIDKEEEDEGLHIAMKGSQKVGEYTVSGLYKIKNIGASSDSNDGAAVTNTAAQVGIATKTWSFAMGGFFDEFDGNQRGMKYAVRDMSMATDYEGYHDGFVFKYKTDGLTATFVQQIGMSGNYGGMGVDSVSGTQAGYVGSKIFGASAGTGYTDGNGDKKLIPAVVMATGLKAAYAKDAIDAIFMYATGEAKGDKTFGTAGYSRKATSMQLGFAFNAGTVIPFVNYSAVTETEKISADAVAGVASQGGTITEKDGKTGNGYTAYEIGADVDLGDGLGLNAFYSNKKTDTETSATEREDTWAEVGVKKAIGPAYFGGSYSTQLKGQTNGEDSNFDGAVIAVKAGYTF